MICHKCSKECSGFTSGWTFADRVDPSTSERTRLWRCDRCNFHAAVGVPERVKRGQRNGGKASAAISRGATDTRGKRRA